MRRGGVYWINLEAASPPELGKVRPAIVVSNPIYNERLDSVVVVPLSGRAPEIWPLRLRVDLRGMKVSYAVIPGIRQVSKARLCELVGHMAPAALARADEAITLYLGE